MKTRCKRNTNIQLPPMDVFHSDDAAGCNPHVSHMTVARRIRDMVMNGKLVRTGKKGMYCKIKSANAQTQIALKYEQSVMTEVKELQQKVEDKTHELLKELYNEGLIAMTVTGKYVRIK